MFAILISFLIDDLKYSYSISNLNKYESLMFIELLFTTVKQVGIKKFKRLKIVMN